MTFKTHPGKNIYKIKNRLSQSDNRHVIIHEFKICIEHTFIFPCSENWDYSHEETGRRTSAVTHERWFEILAKLW